MPSPMWFPVATGVALALQRGNKKPTGYTVRVPARVTRKHSRFGMRASVFDTCAGPCCCDVAGRATSRVISSLFDLEVPVGC